MRDSPKRNVLALSCLFQVLLWFSSRSVFALLSGDGIYALQGAFSREWASLMREDIERLFAEARSRPQGALPRGPERYYVECAPEQIKGFVDIATHPWFVAVCSS